MASMLDSPPPSLLDLGSLSQEIENMFRKSETPTTVGQPTWPKSTNASLDPLTVKALLASVLGDDIGVSTLHATVTSSECRVLYGVDKPDINERVFIEFTQCITSSAAEAHMRGYLSSFEVSPSKVAWPANIGTYSLQTAQSVFWVRDTMFAKIFVNGPTDILDDPDEEKTDDRLGKVLPKPLPAHLIRDVAHEIDHHLAKCSVSPEGQLKPEIALPIQNLKVKAGETFQIRLSKVNNLHEIKPSEIEDTSLVIQAANGSASGEYTFFAMKAGKTNIRLVLAHAETLAVGFQDVDVVVVQNTPLGIQGPTPSVVRATAVQETQSLPTWAWENQDDDLAKIPWKTICVVDDSSSMELPLNGKVGVTSPNHIDRTRWGLLCKVLNYLADDIALRDEDGIDMYLLTSGSRGRNIRNGEKLLRALQEVNIKENISRSRKGFYPTLELILRKYVSELEGGNDKETATRPLWLIVLTDSAPYDKLAVEIELEFLTERLRRSTPVKLETHIRIQFVLVGEDKDAAEYFKYLASRFGAQIPYLIADMVNFTDYDEVDKSFQRNTHTSTMVSRKLHKP